jgi:type IV secretion system protein VirB4
MQFLQGLMSISPSRPDYDREAPAAKHLPYALHRDPHTLETDDGLLVQFIKLRGLMFETADSEELDYRKYLRDALLQSLGNSRYAIYHHILRRRIECNLSADFPDAFSQKIDARWRERLSARQLYANEIYLSLVRRPLHGQLGIVERARDWLGFGSANDGNSKAGDIRQLDAVREALTAGLSAYEPQTLGLYEAGSDLCSEPIEFLSALFNGALEPRQLPYQSISSYIPARRISFGHNAIELAESGHLRRRFSAIISIKDYAGHSQTGSFDALLRLPFEMTLAQSFAFTDRRETIQRMNLALRRMRSTEDEALSLREDLSLAKDDVAAGRTGFGEHHMTIAVHADVLATLDNQVSEVTAQLSDMGISAIREDVGLELAFWAQFPANFKYIVRRGLISTRNFAGLASSHNFSIGRMSGNHWGEAVSLLETTAAGPYFFNFHHGDLGNFTIIGPSGSGKTVVLNFLLAQARKYHPRIVFFDKDRGSELFIRAMQGHYDRLYPDAASGLNPLQVDDTQSNRQFLTEWIMTLAGGADGAELAMITDALDANFDQSLAYRRLRHLVELFRGGNKPQNGDLWSRLTPWWGDGDRAWLFDNECDGLDLSAKLLGFDMTAILDDPICRTPAMMYLFHRVEERLDGTPSIIVVDEGWKALDDPIFVRRMKDWEKTIRKRNGLIGFITQNATDALSSQISSAIIEQSATQIFMVNPKANRADYCEGFGLSAHEFSLVKSLPDNAHCFLVKHAGESVLARLNLSADGDLLAILSGREASVRKADAIRAVKGPDTPSWLEGVMGQRP